MSTVKSRFKVGSVVVLKSGGPAMTVVRISPDDLEDYMCYWFAGRSLNKGWFSGTCITENLIREYK